MIERRGRKLPLTRLCQLTVKGDHLPQDFQMLIEEPVFFSLGKMAALIAQPAKFGITLEYQWMNPSEVEPHLQIAEVALLEATQRLARRVSSWTASLQ